MPMLCLSEFKLARTDDEVRREMALCLSEIKSGYIRDAIRRGLDGKEYALPSLRCAIGAHPCPRPSACASHYSSEREISECGADVPRLSQGCGPNTPAGSIRSTVRQSRSARVRPVQ